MSDLVQLWLQVIDLWRERIGALSKDELRFISKQHDYTHPCQVDVVHLLEPELMGVIVSHFPERPDKKVIYNGPYGKADGMAVLD